MNIDNPVKILIVDDNKDVCAMLSELMEQQGYCIAKRYSGEGALKAVKDFMPDIVLLDVRMPYMDGMEVLSRIKKMDPAIPVILITAYADINSAVNAVKQGAYYYIAKPFEHQNVVRIIRQALSERFFRQSRGHLRGASGQEHQLKRLMGPSEAVARLVSDIECVAASNFSVLVLGETGSGKELVAKAIHSVSRRPKSSFIPVDCGAIPDTLFESELFGHEKGAFTGAISQKPGKFEVADSGTLFLDEIQNMPLNCQVKLLRVLQDRTVWRIGATNPVPVDVRLLVASNQDLEGAVSATRFRQDLFFRLNEFTIRIPPLRERQDDIPYLAERFLIQTAHELKKDIKGFSEEAMERLTGHYWPGNVRELRTVVRRAVLVADDMIRKKHLDINGAGGNFGKYLVSREISWKGKSLKEIKREKIMAIERETIIKALSYTNGNKAKAARLLKVDYKTILTKLKQLGISA